MPICGQISAPSLPQKPLIIIPRTPPQPRLIPHTARLLRLLRQILYPHLMPIHRLLLLLRILLLLDRRPAQRQLLVRVLLRRSRVVLQLHEVGLCEEKYVARITGVLNGVVAVGGLGEEVEDGVAGACGERMGGRRGDRGFFAQPFPLPSLSLAERTYEPTLRIIPPRALPMIILAPPRFMNELSPPLRHIPPFHLPPRKFPKKINDHRVDHMRNLPSRAHGRRPDLMLRQASGAGAFGGGVGVAAGERDDLDEDWGCGRGFVLRILDRFLGVLLLVTDPENRGLFGAVEFNGGGAFDDIFRFVRRVLFHRQEEPDVRVVFGELCIAPLEMAELVWEGCIEVGCGEVGCVEVGRVEVGRVEVGSIDVSRKGCGRSGVDDEASYLRAAREVSSGWRHDVVRGGDVGVVVGCRVVIRGSGGGCRLGSGEGGDEGEE